ncbi:MAG: cupin domain-containing protein [Christiangramia sp.]|nr:cupin domain-containing protein [Christiangramia sp.]
MRTRSRKFRTNIAFIVLAFLCLNFSSFGQSENSIAVNIHDSNMEWGECPDFIPNGCNVAILQGDPTKNNADAIFKFQPDTDIPEHWHNSAERMILIQGELTVTYEGEATKNLKAGYYAYGPSKKPHIAKCVGDEPCLLYVGFIKPVDAYPGNGK